eukprot:4407312-Prymnesium_polylepis.1
MAAARAHHDVDHRLVRHDYVDCERASSRSVICGAATAGKRRAPAPSKLVLESSFIVADEAETLRLNSFARLAIGMA